MGKGGGKRGKRGEREVKGGKGQEKSGDQGERVTGCGFLPKPAGGQE